MLTPRSETESAIVELWKEFRPNEAFVLGIDECAGRVFVPTPAKVRQIQARISRIRRKTRDPTERKLLASFRAALELREPAQLPQSLVETMFGYLIKEGTNADHLASFARFGRRALDARRRQVRRVPPPGMRALVQLACSGLADMLKTVEGELRETRAHEAIRALIAANARYAKAFDLPGFPVDGSFQDVYAFFKRSGCDLGRSQSYARALRDFWDYEQTPAQVEAAGLRMIRRELPHFHALVQRFAEELSCGATAEAVTGALKEKRGLRPDQILPFLKEVRDPARRVAHKHVVAINPDYATDAVAGSLERLGGLGRVSRVCEFLTALWRIVRFLPVIGDARINSGKQDLVHFVEWAYRTTGVERATVYYQLFPAHQVIGPGYASTYAIIGERIREIQQEALKRGKSLRDFNAYASSIGWPPKSVFEAELEAWARSP